MNDFKSPTPARCAMYLRSATGDRSSLLGQEEACHTAAAGHEPEQIKMNSLSTQSVRYVVYGRTATNVAESSSIIDQVKECIAWAAETNPYWVQAETHVYTALSSIDEGFIDRLAKKVRRGQHAKMANGYSVGGRCFGYSSVPVFSPDGAGLQGNKLTVSEPEAATIRRIYREFAAGVSAPKIAKALNVERVPSPVCNGARFHGWTLRSVYAVLRQPRYRGKLIWGRTQHVRNPETGRVELRQMPDEKVIKLAAPEHRIVGVEMAASVDARLGASDRT